MNPRAAINDLLPFQGSPFGQLGYFSKLPFQIFSYPLFSISNGLNYNSSFLVLSSLFSSFFHFFDVFLSFPTCQNKRREWDSNPRALADKRFSRPPRYDHFDISPYRIFTLFSHLLCQRRSYSIIKTCRCQYRFYIFCKNSLPPRLQN